MLLPVARWLLAAVAPAGCCALVLVGFVRGRMLRVVDCCRWLFGCRAPLPFVALGGTVLFVVGLPLVFVEKRPPPLVVLWLCFCAFSGACPFGIACLHNLCW